MKRLLLLGGGHAHVEVLTELARRPFAGCEVHLVSPYPRQIYSGMLPGWVAGHYQLEQCVIALDALARNAAVPFHETAARAVDLTTHTVQCMNGESLRFDWLSIDTGPVAALARLPGAAEHALPIRPIEGFVATWPQLADRIARQRDRFDFAILGAGAGGIELAFAIRQRARREGWSHLQVHLVGSEDLPLDGTALPARRRALHMLQQRGIRWHGPRRAVEIEAGSIHFSDGPPLPFDACLVVTGPSAPAWPKESGLAVDESGFVRVGDTLQSVSHAHVFAAGDVAAHAPRIMKSGVYAVRAGKHLARTLRLVCAGAAAQPWTPQARALYLISSGDRNALAIWSRWSVAGHWLWLLKDAIDRRYICNKSPHVQ